MIISDKYVWLHVPKTGGTSVEQMFRIIGSDYLLIDDKKNPRKHDSYETKQQITGLDLTESRVRISNIRRLPEWVLSYNVHKSWKIPFSRQDVIKGNINTFFPLPNLQPISEKEVVSNWETYNHRSTPDKLLKYLTSNRVDIWIRTENLAEDFLNSVGQYEEITEHQRSLIQKTFINKRHYNRRIKHWFQTKEEMIELYDLNPLWASYEQEVYGNLLYEIVFQ
jgi:hypothetical protein